MSRGIMFGRGDWTILAALLALLTSVPASTAFVSYQSNSTTARRFMVSQVQTHEYPYTVSLCYTCYAGGITSIDEICAPVGPPP